MWPGLHQVARPLMNAYSCLAKRCLHRACGKDQTSLGCNLLFLSLPHLLQRYLCPDGFATRIAEADAFYAAIQPATLTDDERLVQRQAFAGMLWSKQFFHYDVAEWLRGDSAQPTPPATRRWGRNREWYHVSAHHVISMPDKWEYPWFAAWDLAFHCVTLALVDLDFAKEQLLLMCREWFQHPNGQLAAYEWAFGDVNPPVLAWAAVKIYKIESQQSGKGDLSFLHQMFQKL